MWLRHTLYLLCIALCSGLAVQSSTKAVCNTTTHVGCNNVGTCVVGLHGISKCFCHKGWEGVHCDTDTDDCLSLPCGRNGTCTDQPGRYTCDCHKGFVGFNCSYVDKCLSLNANQECSLIDPNTGENRVLCKVGWTGKDCQQDEDECARKPTNPCQRLNMANQCINKNGSFECKCDPRFTGAHCKMERRYCSSNPCINGDCRDKTGGFECLCQAGFTGVQCHETSKCLNDSCNGHGTCKDKDNSFVCQCDLGWKGDRCQSVNHCYNNKCAQGKCEEKHDSYICRCDKGFKGELCDHNINDCFPNPCVHGQCVDLANNFHCQCDSGFQGKRCSATVDKCSANPCLNGGSCVQNFDKTTCVCVPGFEGTYCERLADLCKNSPCSTHGTCLSKPYGAMCKCNAGFTGPRCTQTINWCSPKHNLCKNNGKCTLQPPLFTCNCTGQWSGQTCEIPKAEVCKPRTCKHGKCVNLKDGAYSCQCDPGFKGEHCEHKIPFCKLHTCQNGGNCSQTLEKCECLTGFTGNFCEKNIDNCKSTPCNHGTCEDAVNGFICHCEKGYHGLYCEKQVATCFPGACYNGGTCQSSGSTYTCTCPPGYQGSRCQKKACLTCAPKLCSVKSCGNYGRCNNLKNDFECICDENFTGDDCSLSLISNQTSCPYTDCHTTRSAQPTCNQKCNIPQCDWDGTACTLGTEPWAQCKVLTKRCWKRFEDGVCDPECNTMECLFDGGDCQKKTKQCSASCVAKFGNGVCDPECNTEECGYDNRDCDQKQPAAMVPGQLEVTLETTLEEFNAKKSTVLRQLSVMLNTHIILLKVEYVEDEQVASRRKRRAVAGGKRLKLNLRMDNSKCQSDCFETTQAAAKYLGAKAQKNSLNLPFKVVGIGHKESVPPTPGTTMIVIIITVSSLAIISMLVVAKKMRTRFWHNITPNSSNLRRPPVGAEGEAFNLQRGASECSVDKDWNDIPNKRAKFDNDEIVETKKLMCTSDTNMLLHEAIFANDISRVKQLIDQGADINGKDENGLSPLQKTIIQYKQEIFKLFMHRSCYIDQQCNEGRTPLMMACQSKGTIGMMEELISVGARVTLTDNHGRTALHYAAVEDNSKAAYILLKNNAKIDAQDMLGQTALRLATLSGAVDTVQVLLSHYANKNIGDNVDRTPLMAAQEMNNPTLINLLSDWSDSPNNISPPPSISPDNIAIKPKVAIAPAKRKRINKRKAPEAAQPRHNVFPLFPDGMPITSVADQSFAPMGLPQMQAIYQHDLCLDLLPSTGISGSTNFDFNPLPDVPQVSMFDMINPFPTPPPVDACSPGHSSEGFSPQNYYVMNGGGGNPHYHGYPTPSPESWKTNSSPQHMPEQPL